MLLQPPDLAYRILLESPFPRLAPAPVLSVITPAAPVITVDRARLHCKIAGADRDAELADAVETARAWTQEWLKLPLGTQTLAWTFDCWPGDFTLPYDVTTVVSVTAAGVALAYTKQGRHLCADAAAATPVVITVDCGIAADAIPMPIKSAMLLIVGDLIRNQQSQVEAELYRNPAVDNLLAMYRERLPL